MGNRKTEQMLKTLVQVRIFTLMLLCFFWGNVVPAEPQSLNSLRWKNRLILVNPVAEQHYQQLQRFQRAFEVDILERKVKVLRQLANGLFAELAQTSSGHWQSKEKVPPAKARLIGLDGGVKAEVSISTENLADLLWQIDTMPMRQRELKSQ